MNKLNTKTFQQQVKIEDLPSMICECEGRAFITLYELRFASKFVAGQNTVVRIPRGYLCLRCRRDNCFVGAEQYYGVSGIQKSPFKTEELDEIPISSPDTPAP